MMEARLRAQLKVASSPFFMPVRGGLLQRKCACSGTPGPSGEREGCHQKKQRKNTNAQGETQNDSAVPQIIHEVLCSTGQPLDPATRFFFEPRFGHDFGNVRVHTDARAAESAHAVNAAAYTVGRHIVFGAREPQLESRARKQLLAHELTHVTQQRNHDDDAHLGESRLGPQGDACEQEAEAMGNDIAAGKSTGEARNILTRPILQRGILDVLATPFIALARVFGAENYSDDELLSYYNNFVAKGLLEDAYDSDNKARALVKRWKNNRLTFTPKEGKSQTITLSASDKVALGKEMYQGHPSGDDISCVLELLRSSTETDVSTIVAGMGEPLLKTEEETAHFVAARSQQKKKEPAAAAPPQPAIEGESAAPAPPELSVETTFGYEVPGLDPDKRAKVEELIKTKDIQAAINMIVQYGGGAGGSNIDTSLLADGQMKYDSSITSEDADTGMASWDYIKNKAEPAKVRIGQKAFSSVPYLYSVIMHEYQHVLWNQSLKNQEIGRETHEEGRQGGGMYTSEVEAYAWELLHAEESGLSKIPEKIAGVWSNLNEEFWKTDAATQARMRSKVQRAWAEAKRFVRGTKVELDPFRKL